MSSEAKIDYQRQALAAMKLAVAANGLERMNWVRVAQAWQEMGRWVEQRDGAAPGTSAVRAEHGTLRRNAS